MELTEAEIINHTLAYIARNRMVAVLSITESGPPEEGLGAYDVTPILSVLLAYEEEMRRLHEGSLPQCNCHGTMAGSHDPTCPAFGESRFVKNPGHVMHYRTPQTFTAPCGVNPVPGLHWTTERTAVTCPTCKASFE